MTSSMQSLPLESVTEIIGGGTPSRNEASYFGGEIPWATPTDVTRLNGMTLSATKETITSAGLKNSSAKLLPAKSVLLTSRATIGFVAVSSVPMATNQGFINFVCGPKLIPEYLARWLLTQKDTLLSLAGGTTFKEVSKGNVRKLRIPVPPLDEQQRIVDILDRAASIQRLRQAADEKLKQIIPALFVDMFGDPADNPKGLPLAKLGDLIERIETGKNVTAGSGTSEYSILKVSAVTSGTYKEHESKPAPDNHMVVQNHIVREGDFLFSRANTVDLVGATAIVQQTNGKTLLPDKLWRIRWHKDVDPRYMLAVMQNAEIRAELGRASSGTSASMRNISQGRLASIEVPLASFEQQQQFGRIAEALTAKASLSHQASQHAQSAAASLTQSVFGG